MLPESKIIASSREALGIDGETVYRVPSLKDDEATRLFVERATKAEPRFHITERTLLSSPKFAPVSMAFPWRSN